MYLTEKCGMQMEKDPQRRGARINQRLPRGCRQTEKQKVTDYWTKYPEIERSRAGGNFVVCFFVALARKNTFSADAGQKIFRYK